MPDLPDPGGTPPAPSGPGRYRWAFTPRWIALHVFVLLCVFGFVRAGLWQLSRLHERRDANALILERRTQDPVPAPALLSLTSTPDQIAAVKYRRVTVTGTYATDDQVLIRNRSNHSAPGYWVITPIVQADGTAVAVNRGWIPLLLGDSGSAASYAPPTGPVEVVGDVLEAQLQEGIGAPDPADGRLTMLSRVDVPRLQQQVTEPLYPAWVELITQTPPQPAPAVGVAVPDPVPPPELDDGPHLNYTGQWFIFATLTCIVYPLVLRRTARNKERAARLAAEDAAARDADDDTAPDRRGPVVDKHGRLAIDLDQDTGSAPAPAGSGAARADGP